MLPSGGAKATSTSSHAVVLGSLPPFITLNMSFVHQVPHFSSTHNILPHPPLIYLQITEEQIS